MIIKMIEMSEYEADKCNSCGSDAEATHYANGRWSVACVAGCAGSFIHETPHLKESVKCWNDRMKQK